MSISQRISKICDFEGSQRKVAEKTGIAQQTLSRMISRQANVRSDNIIAIVKAYPNLNVEWFITGQGEMWKTAKDGKKKDSSSPSDALKDDLLTLQKKRIRELEREIKQRDPELAKRLGIG